MSSEVLQAERRLMSKLYDQHHSHVIESTGYECVNFSDALYNVIGSRHDPEIDGQTWISLLKTCDGIDDETDCYVTNCPPSGKSSHPQFDVGGHMTTNSDGSVPDGGTCYLMPLCKWHNNSARNGKKFEHTSQKMIELSGYNESDTATTFLARVPGPEAFSIVYQARDKHKTEHIDESRAHSAVRDGVRTAFYDASADHFILFKRVTLKDKPYFIIHHSRL